EILGCRRAAQAKAARAEILGCRRAAQAEAARAEPSTGAADAHVDAIEPRPARVRSRTTLRWRCLSAYFSPEITLVTAGTRGVDTISARLWRGWGGHVEDDRVSPKEWARSRGAGFVRTAP